MPNRKGVGQKVQMKTKHAVYVTLLLVLALSLAGCSTLSLPSALLAAPSAAPVSAVSAQAAPPEPSSPAQVPAAVAALESTLEQIYTQVNPSVVSIQVILGQSSGSQFPGSPSPFGPSLPQAAQGSGFVWDKQGHIVTNNHVVADATQVTVIFYDGSMVPATVVGTDPDSDLAVIQVNVPADQLQPVVLADSSQVKVGQLAIAIGNPFGLAGTMTHGIVSALARSLPVESGQLQGPTYTIPDIIQTDAPINPGNSGGVLVNDMGQVIGVTAALESSSQSVAGVANSGVAFAIPSNIVNRVVPALIQTGSYAHPWIGISGTNMTPDLAQAMGLPANQRGGLVIDVTPNSPAAAGGLQGSTTEVTINGEQVPVGGDVIVAVNGQPVKAFDDLIAYLADYTTVGQTITLTVLRSGNQVTVNVTLGARPGTQPAVQTPPSTPTPAPAAGPGYLGIVGVTVTPEIDQAMNLPQTQLGVLVEQVQPGSGAAQAGLQGSFTPVTINGTQLLVGGDIITALNGQTVTSIDDLRAALQQTTAGQNVTLTILRNGVQQQVPVTLGEQPNSGS
jgi:serine protease Do